ncbi:phage tail protein [Marinicrinis sediminis]|uniref:Phage tail protein n=1 Tax=Marinicrinis sediminis TaxID=1652465 RepID=A0ABW5REM1_9BACL
MDGFLGEIRIFAGRYAPEGWAMCNGQLLAISQNDALYSLIGTTYGGDGINSFALPDLRGRLPLHQGERPSSSTLFRMGQRGGSEEITLLSSQMPSHTHSVSSSKVGSTDNPTNAFWGTGPSPLYSDNSPSSMMSSQAISKSGGNLAHENMMPFLALTYIIALVGTFPTRS